MLKHGISYKSALFFFSLFFFGNFTLANKIIYVDDDAAGSNDGSSWQNAYICLQDALADANLAEKPVEIRVAQGTYKPDQGADLTDGGREGGREAQRKASFVLINNLTLSGGYAGVIEADPNERNIDKYKTILSGDLAGNDNEVNDPKELLDEPTRNENSFNIITCNVKATLDGFLIICGNAEATGRYNHRNGGAIFSERNSNLTLLNCTLNRNSARYNGGGIFNNFGSLNISCCNFEFNSSGYYGGGIYNYDSYLHEQSFFNCIFEKNSSFSGGGLYNESSNTVLVNCRFTDNIAVSIGGGLYNSYSDTVIKNCIINKNTSFSNGGGLNGCGNIVNCLFTGNKAYINGGGINVQGYATFTNCILQNNLASKGNELYLDSFIRYGEIKPHEIRSSVLIEYSHIQNETNDIYVEPNSILYYLDGNINTDPCFVYPGYWDPNGTTDDANDDFWIDGDYHLKSQAGRWDSNLQNWVLDDVTSPCIDAGDPNSPIDLEPFPNGGYINMGAYGGTSEASKSYFGKPVCETIVAGDINGDCKVDILDLEILLLHWLDEY